MCLALAEATCDQDVSSWRSIFRRREARSCFICNKKGLPEFRDGFNGESGSSGVANHTSPRTFPQMLPMKRLKSAYFDMYSLRDGSSRIKYFLELTRALGGNMNPFFCDNYFETAPSIVQQYEFHCSRGILVAKQLFTTSNNWAFSIAAATRSLSFNCLLTTL